MLASILAESLYYSFDSLSKSLFPKVIMSRILYYVLQQFQASANKTSLKIAGLMSIATEKEYHMSDEVMKEVVKRMGGDTGHSHTL